MRNFNRSSLLVFFIAVFLLVSCGHETLDKFQDIEKNNSLNNEQKIIEMAKAAWMFIVVDSSRDWKVVKIGDNQYRLIGSTIDTSGISAVNANNFKSVTTKLDAIYVWRLFQGAEKFGLKEIVYSHYMKPMGSDQFLIYKMHVTTNQLDSKVPDWRKLDPFDVGEYDLPNSEAVAAVQDTIPTVWTYLDDNFSDITIGGQQAH